MRHLTMAYRERQHGHDIKSSIWKEFGGGNKAAREKGLKPYRATLERETKK
ncbi:hypothetical protein HC752_20320 [Vibrio sp. S9_S30]|uniref:hypothetical protein n=1 Tax=Vibrio sp. S9_S30 TaxID=2720226 RepID=UPI001680EAC4|nr:hypothetical protein [Vibrio sp. S9_S30]MBD1559290.1 hypothetical protein [Vibrio sp. S9_S30]